MRSWGQGAQSCEPACGGPLAACTTECLLGRESGKLIGRLFRWKWAVLSGTSKHSGIRFKLSIQHEAHRVVDWFTHKGSWMHERSAGATIDSGQSLCSGSVLTHDALVLHYRKGRDIASFAVKHICKTTTLRLDTPAQIAEHIAVPCLNGTAIMSDSDSLIVLP